MASKTAVDRSGGKYNDSTEDAGPNATLILQAPVHGDMSTAVALTAAAPAGEKWVVTDIFVSCAGEAEISLREESSNTDIWGPIMVPALFNGQFVPRSKLKLATAVKKVMGKSSTSAHVTIQVGGYTEE